MSNHRVDIEGGPPRPSHHRPGGGFRNPWPNAKPRGFPAVLRWMVQRKLKRRAADPAPRAFPRVRSDIAYPRASPDRLSATWVGHSTVLLQMAGMNILTDPVWSARASPVTFAGPKRWVEPGIGLEALPPLDVLLLSHNHYDHLDDRTVRRLAAAHPEVTWAVPLGLAEFVRSRGASRVLELDWWQEATVARTRLTCAPAQHFSARGVRDRDQTLWCAWVLRSDPLPDTGGHGWSVFFGGDSGLHPDFASIGERLGPFDLTLMPIGAYDPRWFMAPVHMDPEEALQAFHALNRRASGRSALLPIHWGTFKLTDEAMDEPPRRLRAAWKNAMGEELWLLAHGETRWW